MDANRSRSKPDRGVIQSFIEVINQNEEVVMTVEGDQPGAVSGGVGILRSAITHKNSMGFQHICQVSRLSLLDIK